MGKKPKTIYNEKYFLKRWEKFLKADKKTGSITKQNVLAFRVELDAAGCGRRFGRGRVWT